ncbi:MAG: hypothetical protein Q8Q69_06445 [Nitrosopumilaceae archaeon]|nr:hypothetical protein [Nitrosopumilaceae archaeon]
MESCKHSIPLVSRIMTRHRFEDILANWHFVDTSTTTLEEQERQKGVDPFWTVTELVEFLSDKSQQYWTLGQNFDIDEQSVPFKGRHRCKVCNRNKPFNPNWLSMEILYV